MKNKWWFALLIPVLLLVIVSTGQREAKDPVMLTLWHNFGGQMQETMDELVDEFNYTVGREQGIILNVTAISGSAVVQDKLTMIANEDARAPDMPDITTCYPATAELLYQKGLLAELEGYFTEAELSDYLSRFIEEGRLTDGKLYVFPIAKSTEVIFMNQTLFDRFSDATGVTVDSLSTFEGLAETAMRYYEWTDGQTPDVADDGKSFFAADSLFNIAQVGMRQMGENIFDGEELNLSGPEFKRIWETLYVPAVKGGYAVYEGFPSDLSKTGEIVCAIGSTAGVLFYGDEIVYPDNTVERAEYTALPYPVFEGGEKVAIQRGNGMVITKSTPEREEAAAAFLRWFTQPEQNMRFVASTGYLPVTNTAFENVNMQKLLRTALRTYSDYDFYIPPVMDSFNETSEAYESDFLESAEAARAEYLRFLSSMTENEACEKAVQGKLDAFIAGRKIIK